MKMMPSNFGHGCSCIFGTSELDNPRCEHCQISLQRSLTSTRAGSAHRHRMCTGVETAWTGLDYCLYPFQMSGRASGVIDLEYQELAEPEYD